MISIFWQCNNNSDASDETMHLFADEPGFFQTEHKENPMTFTVPNSIEQKIAQAVEKVKSLKEEKEALQTRVAALEQEIRQKDAEIASITEEKLSVKHQIETLLDELDNLVASA